MIKIPYGDSNYAKIINRKRYYADRTQYIEKLEDYPSDYIFFLRPRKFGKSLFLSMLEHYYDINRKKNFQKLFGHLYIGQHTTDLANTYLILKFDFSQIDTSSFENTFRSFTLNVKESAKAFLGRYPNFFDVTDINGLDIFNFPSAIIQYILRIVELKTHGHKIYLLIDEYDHFANEILSFRFNEFMTMVGRNGFVRKFYEAIKVGTQHGTIEQLFVTGVSPITLDSLTSGFNIATNISLKKEFSEMLGFSETEVIEILKGVEVPKEELSIVLGEMKAWYNGYKFNLDVENRIYNSNMILYFAAEYSRGKQYPRQLLDPNIASDYTKIRKSFKIKGKEKEHLTHLSRLLKTGFLQSSLVHQYDLDKRFNANDFISLLYYQGIITIWTSKHDSILFKTPNYVIKQLYFQYFHQIILEQSHLDGKGIDIRPKVIELADDNNMKPMIHYTESILQELAVRDKMNFNEKHIKTIFTSAFYISNIYTIFNEFEVKKGKTDKGFVDLLLIQRTPYKPKYQFVIEFKYVKKQDAKQADKVKKEAVAQLKTYLKHDNYLRQLKNLKAYVVVFVGNKGTVIEVATDV